MRAGREGVKGNLRVDEGKLDDVQVLDGDGVAHRAVDSLERCVLAHAERREQAWHLGHLVCAEGGVTSASVLATTKEGNSHVVDFAQTGRRGSDASQER